MATMLSDLKLITHYVFACMTSQFSGLKAHMCNTVTNNTSAYILCNFLLSYHYCFVTDAYHITSQVGKVTLRTKADANSCRNVQTDDRLDSHSQVHRVSCQEKMSSAGLQYCFEIVWKSTNYIGHSKT